MDKEKKKKKVTTKGDKTAKDEKGSKEKAEVMKILFWRTFRFIFCRRKAKKQKL